MKRTTTANSRFAACGVTCKLGVLYFYSSFVMGDSFVLKKRQCDKH
jgi:hypothetical protein